MSTLRELASARDFRIGAAASTRKFSSNPKGEKILVREFNSLTTENALKWGWTTRDGQNYDFTRADSLVKLAHSYDMRVRGHCLVWHRGLPRNFDLSSLNPGKLQKLLEKHVARLTSRYSNIPTWDVVNEAIDDKGKGLRDSFWLEKLGLDYIRTSYKTAAEHTEASLFYNDFDIAGNSQKKKRTFDLLEELLEEGVPIHGVGLQMHSIWPPRPGYEEIYSTIKKFQQLGLKVEITELDVAFNKSDIRKEKVEEKQAEYYGNVLKACLDADADGLTVWGISDRNSWSKNEENHKYFTDGPLLFDEKNQPKKAYHVMKDILKNY